ncbi:hypothetical protein Droror1_Dr00018625 [Drosera rotundifolia]
MQITDCPRRDNTSLKGALSMCDCRKSSLAFSSPEEYIPITTDDYSEHEVIVALIRARAVEAEYKHGISQVTEQYSSAFNSSVIELHVAASRAQKAKNDEDEDEDEFLTARSSASYCSSSADTEAFFSVKTIFSCSDVNSVKSEYLAEPHRRSVMQEFSHCEGWPFGLCRKTLMNPPPPNPPSAPWLWYKDGVKIVRRHTLPL